MYLLFSPPYTEKLKPNPRKQTTWVCFLRVNVKVDSQSEIFFSSVIAFFILKMNHCVTMTENNHCQREWLAEDRCHGILQAVQENVYLTCSRKWHKLKCSLHLSIFVCCIISCVDKRLANVKSEERVLAYIWIEPKLIMLKSKTQIFSYQYFQ